MQQPVDAAHRRQPFLAVERERPHHRVVRAASPADLREPERANLPDTVEVVQGDLADREAVAAVLKGVDSAFYVSPHEANEIEIATIFGEEAQRAGARLAFGGFHVEDPEARAGAAQAMPDYTGKLRLAAFLAGTDTRPAMFSLTNFDQNDEVFRADIEAGVHPTPLHARGVNRIDLRDAAEVITRALVDPGFAAGSYQLLGPESLNGEQSAQIWAEALGREVVYTGNDPEWRKAFGRRLSGPKLIGWIHSFELLSAGPILTDLAQVATMTELLGHAPRSLRDYVRDSVNR
ncbi:NmrA family NAD(P)-binding protein [Lentzea chajnantorensis]